ncbi:unnamed protein product [Prorocentrum cordatum]|uniref:Uncharacterized protein n=1 Tax=Prorocentrum cordatum TaxID=2364126 RepID=A0ABN9V686_9DINO|nr:unnamed protein product [Polarella glacialis]
MGLLPETSWQFSQSSWRRPSYDCNGPRSIPPPGVLQGAMAKESPESCSGAPSAAIFVLRPPRSETRHPSSPGPPPRPHRATRRRAEAGGARGQTPRSAPRPGRAPIVEPWPTAPPARCCHWRSSPPWRRSSAARPPSPGPPRAAQPPRGPRARQGPPRCHWARRSWRRPSPTPPP